MSVLRSRRRLLGTRLLVLVAGIGFAAAVGHAFAPVDQVTHQYVFHPADTGRDPAIASLAIARSEPDALEVVLPCEAPGSQFRSMTLGNWAASEGAQGSPIEYQDLGIALQVGVGDGYAFMTLGGTEIFRFDIVHVAGCEVSTEFDGHTWTFAIGDTEQSVVAGVPRFAEALFDGVAASHPTASVTVATRELGSSPSGIQILLAGVALVAVGLVARELAVRDRKVPSAYESPLWGRVLEDVGLVDIVVGGGLVAWIFLIPAGFDDGWVVARQGAYDAHGAFSNLFDLDAATLPLAHWVEWVQHFWLGISANSLFARLPILALAGLTWLGVRWMLRSLGGELSRAPIWVMGAVFLVGYGAWDVTLRPEPILALLLVASLALAVRFGRGERGTVLVAWTVVIALAMTAHPAGVIVLAPLLASLRPVWVWLRSGSEAVLIGATTVVLVASLTTLVFFLDANVDTRVESVESLQAGGHDKSIADEPLRYEFLGEAPYGAVMRRASVAFILVGAGLFILGVGTEADPAARLPGRSLILALGALALTPSKWSWHFGGLVGLAALVVALELARRRPGVKSADGTHSRIPDGARWAMGGAGIMVVSTWVWRIGVPWTALDLRTLEWSAGAANVVSVDLSQILVWLVIAMIVALSVWIAGSRGVRSLWLAPEVLMLVSAGLVISVTGGTLAVDVIRTDGWTFGGQNVQSLWGGAGCGLGDEVIIPRQGSLHGLEATSDAGFGADSIAAQAGFVQDGGFMGGAFPAFGVNDIRPDGFNAVLPMAGMEEVGSWLPTPGGGPETAVGGFVSPWQALEEEESVGLMVMGSVWDWDPEGNAIAVQWGSVGDSGVADLGVEHVDASGYFVDWTFVSFNRPIAADRVRLLMRDARFEGEQAWVASSLPLGLSSAPVSQIAEQTDILVSPPLGLYFPCIETPEFDVVAVPTPGVIINLWRVMWETTYAAAAASDRYFRIDIDLDPPVRTPQIGAHLGDPASFVFVSQEYLTGTPARVNGVFTLITP